MTTDCWLLFVVILPLVGRCTFVHSFVPKAPFLQHEQTNGRCHELQQQFPHFGIAEWRDLPYEGPLLDLLKTTAATKQQQLQQQLPKVVSILPFPFNQVLLQGETKELRLYEDRFLQLFDSVMEQQGGIVGMGLLAQSGLIQTIPLCEIEAFQRMEGFGIFVTIRVVGRAQLVAITQQEPYLMGVCLELADEFPQDSTTLQLLTNTMEQTIVTITAMEYRLKKIMEATLLLRDEIDNNNNSDDTDDDDMVRRINIAKLEDQFYQDQSVDNGNDMEDIDDDDNDEITEQDRRGRFQQAYEIAMETDTQGYLYTSKSSSKLEDLSPKELTALSWAAFCTDLIPNSTDAMFRIQAMDETNIIERLKLASKMLKDKKGRVETQLKKAGLNKEEDDKP